MLEEESRTVEPGRSGLDAGMRAAGAERPDGLRRSPSQIRPRDSLMVSDRGSREAASVPLKNNSMWRSMASWMASSWKLITIFTFLSIATPIMLFTSPFTITVMQFLLGCGLAAATWVMVKYPTEKAKERMVNDRVQPEMHLVLGTLLPELAVNLEKLLLWIDLALRGKHFPAYLRYPILNFVAYVTGPLWFALLMLAMVFFLLVVTVISFGLILPFVAPVLGLLLGYALMVPVWVVSVYFFSLWPLLVATVIGTSSEIYVTVMELREQARARKMVKPRVQTQRAVAPAAGIRDAGRSMSPAASQRNPSPGQSWLTKQDLLKMYQERGLLGSNASPPPGSSSPAQGSTTMTGGRAESE